MVEVISGLVVGEKVVVEGALKLRDGSAVSITGQEDETDISENGSKF